MKSQSRKSCKIVAKKYITKRICKDYLAKKIKANIIEYKRGKYISNTQAIAVSYSQTLKKYPQCGKYFVN